MSVHVQVIQFEQLLICMLDHYSRIRLRTDRAARSIFDVFVALSMEGKVTVRTSLEPSALIAEFADVVVIACPPRQGCRRQLCPDDLTTTSAGFVRLCFGAGPRIA